MTGIIGIWSRGHRLSGNDASGLKASGLPGQLRREAAFTAAGRLAEEFVIGRGAG